MVLRVPLMRSVFPEAPNPAGQQGQLGMAGVGITRLQKTQQQAYKTRLASIK